MAIPYRVSFQPGDYIDHYLVEQELGEGTFGVVYKVKDLHGEVLALKLLKLWEIPYDEDRKKVKARFNREFECGKVKSRYLVKSHSYGEYKGNPYLVMEFCPNGTLAKFISDLPSIERINTVALEMLLGLHDLHSNGVFHRDIKPENILFDAEDQVKITDFGIAGFKQQRMTKRNILGHTNNVFGTYAYIAPEQLDRRKAFKAMDAVTDIFSFGVTMYEVLSGGHLPFGSLTNDSELASYMERARKGAWEDLRKYHPDIPQYWIAIIERCLHPDYKTQRYNQVEAIINALGYHIQKAESNAFDSTRKVLVMEVMHGEEKGKQYNLSQLLSTEDGILKLGWMDEQNLHINHIHIKETQTAYISKQHATIEKKSQPERWLIRDGQWREKNGQQGWYPSLNGVFLNSRSVGTGGCEIKPDDIVTIGDTTLKILQRTIT